jgi:hypothetical protein
MKRELGCCILLLGIVFLDASGQTMTLTGDVNGDHVVDLTDGISIMDYIVGKANTFFINEVADVNGDGTIDIADAVNLVNLVADNNNKTDTIKILYKNDVVCIDGSYDDNRLFPSVDGTTVIVTSSNKQPFVCIAEGKCADGRMIINADTTCTLILNNLQLTSKQSAVVVFPNKHKVTVKLPRGSSNKFCDSNSRDTNDETFNACLYSKGAITFTGKGALSVTGSYRNGISSSKNIIVDGVHLSIENAAKNGINCDKFTLKKGRVELHLVSDASKGIKAKEEIYLQSGTITGDAKGNVIIENGETSYCTLLKTDGNMSIEDGIITLSHQGNGGRCFSVDKDMKITGGSLHLECHGDGNSYMTANNEEDYYTPKCITVNGCARIERGYLNLLATGEGGKGIDCSDSLFIGRKGEDFLPEDSLLLVVETRGKALVDNVEEDYREGCPKAIKADNDIELYSGTLRLKTGGQGGEGIECKGSLRAYKTTIIADCYDDCINTGMRCYINGALIYCISHNNDGIDSNGKFSIMDGIVAAISENMLNESFDTEGGRLYIYGGRIIGIGYNEVPISELSTVPFYSTKLDYNANDHNGDGISIKENQYVTVSHHDNAVISLFHQQANNDAFIVVASNEIISGNAYQISDGAKPSMPILECLDGNVVIGGTFEQQNTVLYQFNP